MISIRQEVPQDTAAREALLTRAFGRNRRRKTAERLREGRLAADGLSFTMADARGRLIGTIRLWNVIAGSAGPALLLGPVALEAGYRGKGHGAELMRHALDRARRLGHQAIILVGDAAYYGRFGFSRRAVADLHFPGPVERERLLGLELQPGALDGAEGLVAASGRMEARTRKAA